MLPVKVAVRATYHSTYLFFHILILCFDTSRCETRRVFVLRIGKNFLLKTFFARARAMRECRYERIARAFCGRIALQACVAGRACAHVGNPKNTTNYCRNDEKAVLLHRLSSRVRKISVFHGIKFKG